MSRPIPTRKGEVNEPWGSGGSAPGNYGEQALAQALPGQDSPACERMTGFEPATLTLAR